MSDINKIDNRGLVNIAIGQKTEFKELEKGEDGLTVTIVPDKTTAKELKAQAWQLGVNPVNPQIAEQDASSVKTSSGNSWLTLKDILLWPALWPLREAAYRICQGSPFLFVPLDSILNRLIHSPNEYHGGNPTGEGNIKISIPIPDLIKISLCLGPNTLPISGPRPKKISDDPGQIYYSIKPWSKIREFDSKSGVYFGCGIVFSDKVPDHMIDQVKCLFADYDERTATEFKPEITDGDIEKLDIPEGMKNYLKEEMEHRKKTYCWPTEFMRELLQLKSGEIIYLKGKHYWSDDYHTYGKNDQCSLFLTRINLGNYFMSFGKDEAGIYMSIYDVWDFKVGEGGFYRNKVSDNKSKLYDKNGRLRNFIENMEPAIMSAITKPIYVYDRYYISDKDITNELERRASEDFEKGQIHHE